MSSVQVHNDHATNSEPKAPAATTRNGRMIAIAAALLVSAVSMWASAHFQRPAPPQAQTNPDLKVAGNSVSIAKGAPQWQLVKLGVAEPSGQQWTDPVPAYVKVDETHAARIGAPLGGRVNRVFVELGQPVKTGDALFSVASPDMAALQQESASARASLEAARLQHDRVQAMVQARALPAKEEVAASMSVRQAELAYNTAQSKISALRVSSSSNNEFVIKSPRAGFVVDKNVLPGQEIGPDVDVNLMMIADLSSVWVVAELFESNAGGIAKGTKARIEVASNVAQGIDGVVELVSAVVDPARHTIPVRVQLSNTSGELKPNTYARMQFLAAATPGAVEVASSALVTDGDQQYVYVRGQDGSFSRRDVVGGAVRRGKVMVLSGLRAGETVAETGATLLDNQIALAQ
jgi:cobalt-zinc-cadmium efflux system membrane fusion protein